MDINRKTLDDLFQTIESRYRDGLTSFESTSDRWADTVTSTSDTTIYPVGHEWPKMREWLGDRQYKELTMFEFRLKNRKFESTVTVERDNIEDNQIDWVPNVSYQQGVAAAEWKDDLAYEALINSTTVNCFDGTPAIGTAHPVGSTTQSNLRAGGGQPLWVMMSTRKFGLKPFVKQIRVEPEIQNIKDIANPIVFDYDKYVYGIRGRGAAACIYWQLAYGSTNLPLDTAETEDYQLRYAEVLLMRRLMMARKSEAGRPLNIMPNLIVTGTAHMNLFEEIFGSDTLPGGGRNPLYKTMEVVVDARFDV